MTPLRLAIIGAGHLGRIHTRLACQLESAEVVAVAEPNEAAAAAIAEEFGVKVVRDYRELLGDIDAAIVASPTITHEEVTNSLLDHGIDVLVEKPLADSAEAAARIVNRAERLGRTVQVGHVERFNPAFELVMRDIRDPKYIETERLSAFSFRSTDIGVVLDLMIHDIDLVLSLVQEPVVHVDAFGFSVLGGHEDLASARIVFAGGCIAQLTASRVSYEMRRQLKSFSARDFTGINFVSGEVTKVRPSAELAERKFDVSSMSDAHVGYLKEHFFEEVLCRSTVEIPKGNAIAAEQREFVASIRQSRAPRVTAQAGRDAIVVAEQVLASIAAHCWDGSADQRIGPLAVPPPVLGGPEHFIPPGPPQRKAG